MKFIDSEFDSTFVRVFRVDMWESMEAQEVVMEEVREASCLEN